MHNLHIIDVCIIFGYLLICLILGLVNFKKIKSIQDYTLGSRIVTTPLLVGTLFATHFGAASTIGSIEKVYSLGIVFAVIILIGPFIWLTSSLVFSPRLIEFKAKGCITLSDVMEILYGKPGRWITNVAAKLMAVAVITMQVLAIGYLLSYFLGVTQVQGALIGFGVLVIYSVLGGIKAVIVTDAFQAMMLFIGFTVACCWIFYQVGGTDIVMSSLPITYTKFEISKVNKGVMFCLAMWMIMPHSHGVFIQRFLMSGTKAQLRQATKMLFFGSFPIAIVVCVIGYLIKAKVPEINSDIAFFYLIDLYLPAGIKGLVITGILAAIMSTADSWLNTASILWAHDISKKLFPNISGVQELMIARISLIGVAALATFIAFFGTQSLIALEWVACSFWEPIIFIPLVTGFLGFRTPHRVKAFIIASISGVGATLIGAYIFSSGPNLFTFDTVSMCTGLVGSFLGLFGTHHYQNYRKVEVDESIFD